MGLTKRLSRKCLNIGDKALLNTLRIGEILKTGKSRKQYKMEGFCKELVKDVKNDIHTGFECDLCDEQGWLELAVDEGWFTFERKWTRKTLKQFFQSLGELMIIGFLAPPVGIIGLTLRFSLTQKDVRIYPSSYVNISGNFITPDVLKIATLNVACTEFDTMNWINGVRPTVPRIKEYRDFLGMCDAHVMCFQEAFDVEGISDILIPSLLENGYNVAITDTRKYRLGFTAGLMIASVYPIRGAVFKAYSNAVYIDRFANKGVLVLELAISDEESVIVANTHLQGAFHGLSYKERVKHRTYQFECAKDTIQSFMSTSVYNIRGVFMIGDFNTGRFKMNNIQNAIPNDHYISMVSSLFRGAGETESHRSHGGEPQEVQPQDSTLQFKDLMIPTIKDSFEEFYEDCEDYDYYCPTSVETGECRGSCLNTSSLGYNLILKILIEQLFYQFSWISQECILKCIREVLSGKGDPEKEIDRYIIFWLAETLPEIYRKSTTTDHICYADFENNKWNEVDYEYGLTLPIGDGGVLSDHGMVQLSLFPL